MLAGPERWAWSWRRCWAPCWLALVCYLWRDLLSMVQGFLKVLHGKRDGRVRLIGLLLVAAIPVPGGGYACGALCRPTRCAAR